MKTSKQHHLTQKKTYLNINEIENYEHILNICAKYFYIDLGFSQEELKFIINQDDFYNHIKKEDRVILQDLLDTMILKGIDYFNNDHKIVGRYQNSSNSLYFNQEKIKCYNI